MGYFAGTMGGLFNGHIGIGESTCSARIIGRHLGHPLGGNAMLDIIELARVMTERAESARDAIQIAGTLAEQHGFYGGDGTSVNDAGESLSIADENEVWVFNILPDMSGASAIWAAQRVPDGHASVMSNMFTIRDVKIDDNENYMSSEGMISNATALGWYAPERDGPYLDFTKTFSAGETNHPYYSGRRVWRGSCLFLTGGNKSPQACTEQALALSKEPGADPLLKNLASPNMGVSVESPTNPFSVPVHPDFKREDIFALYRDHLEQTEFDMTQGVAAGPYGNSYRPGGASEGSAIKASGAYERTIEIERTTGTYISELKDSDSTSSSRLYVAMGRPATSIFTPLKMYTDAEVLAGNGGDANVPGHDVFYGVDMLIANEEEKMLWANHRISDTTEMMYSKYAPLVTHHNHQVEKVLEVFADSAAYSTHSAQDQLLRKLLQVQLQFGKNLLSLGTDGFLTDLSKTGTEKFLSPATASTDYLQETGFADFCVSKDRDCSLSNFVAMKAKYADEATKNSERWSQEFEWPTNTPNGNAVMVVTAPFGTTYVNGTTLFLDYVEREMLRLKGTTTTPKEQEL